MSKKYKIIYADPPWSYKDKSKSHGGGADSHYTTTSTDDLCNIDVSAVADKDSVMFMWVTYPMLPDGLRLLDAWGFKYKTCAFTWVKTNKGNGKIYMGMGRHTRANAEICLLATKGKGMPREDAGVYNTQLHNRSRHSEKPEAFRDSIEKLYGISHLNNPPRLEMFARCAPEGWDVFGNEAPGSIDIPMKRDAHAAVELELKEDE